MRITWVTRSFLDYRIPVYKALDDLCGNQLTVIYYKDPVPLRAQEKLKIILGERAIARPYELRIGNGAKSVNGTAGKYTFRIPLSPGLIKQVINTQPEALVSDGFMQWTYAPLAIRMIKRIPHVMCYERTAHTERNSGWIRKSYRRLVSKWIDVIDCNGELCAGYVKNLVHFDDTRLTYGHMVADTAGMEAGIKCINDAQCDELRQQLGIKGIMILYVGRLIELKGVRQLLDAWDIFNETKLSDCTLVYVGGGPLEEIMRKHIEDKGIKDVVLTGAINYDQIIPYYKVADCFILPTTSDNWSLVVPEAMACGLPVATTIYNGCHPELVHPENGWVFDSLDRQSIIDVLHKIVKAKDKLQKMGMESKRIVASHTAENAAKSIMEGIIKAQTYCRK